MNGLALADSLFSFESAENDALFSKDPGMTENELSFGLLIVLEINLSFDVLNAGLPKAGLVAADAFFVGYASLARFGVENVCGPNDVKEQLSWLVTVN